MLVAVILSGGRRGGTRVKRKGREAVPRIVLVALAVLGLVAVAIPLAGTTALRDSQALARGGDIPGALGEATTAGRVQPYSASALVQEALVRERAGDAAAMWAVFFFTCGPLSFLLQVGYAESTFLALTFGALLALEHRRYGLLTLLGVAAALAGIALVSLA